MPTTIISTGTDYQLRIDGPSETTKGRVSIGISSKTVFARGTNLVGVILDHATLSKILDDLTDRLNEMEQ